MVLLVLSFRVFSGLIRLSENQPLLLELSNALKQSGHASKLWYIYVCLTYPQVTRIWIGKTTFQTMGRNGVRIVTCVAKWEPIKCDWPIFSQGRARWFPLTQLVFVVSICCVSVSSYEFGMSFPIAIDFFKEVETCWNHQPETVQLQKAFHLSQMADADTPNIDPDPYDMLGKLQSEADFQLKIDFFDGDLCVTQVL